MRNTFSSISYLKRQVVKKDRTVPVMGRITIDGTKTQFSCKLTIDPELLDTKAGRAKHDFTAEQTLAIAQKLYEAKLITYPRTGSRYIPEMYLQIFPP